jgi:hypothetical protein
VSVTVIIQCAGDKDGAYLRSSTGDKVGFVAQPRLAPLRPGWKFVRPDDMASSGDTWRAILSDYNACFVRTADNPDNFNPAWQLYTNPAYRGLAQKFGPDNLYILSAGWGLVRARYLLPNYDITFSNRADPINIRRKGDLFDDARQVPDDVDGPVLFLGGRSYLPFFCNLTRDVRTHRIVYYNSNKQPDAPGCRLIRYETSTRTNWHYECARDLISGRMILH